MRMHASLCRHAFTGVVFEIQVASHKGNVWKKGYLDMEGLIDLSERSYWKLIFLFADFSHYWALLLCFQFPFF